MDTNGLSIDTGSPSTDTSSSLTDTSSFLIDTIYLSIDTSHFAIDTSHFATDTNSLPTHKKRTPTLSGGSRFYSMPAFNRNRQDHLFQQHRHFFECVFDVQAFGALVGVFAEGADV